MVWVWDPSRDNGDRLDIAMLFRVGTRFGVLSDIDKPSLRSFTYERRMMLLYVIQFAFAVQSHAVFTQESPWTLLSENITCIITVSVHWSKRKKRNRWKG